jgi:hypothetical protein
MKNPSLRLNVSAIGLAAIVGAVLLTLAGCAPRYALRPTFAYRSDPPVGVPKAQAWYIESTPVAGGKPASCSFIEFDERGNYLDFQQHRHGYTKLRELAQRGERLLVIIYVHGWKNNCQSGDVVRFNSFLLRIAASPYVKEGGFRVHGVYLAWRGNAFPHAFDPRDEHFTVTKQAFGGEPIVDMRRARGRYNFLYWVPEHLSYWSRKEAAEAKVTGFDLVRTVFTLGYTARRYSDTNGANRVFLMGHSFGALVIEQAFARSMLAPLTAEWPWDDEDLIARARPNPLPFDLVLFVNSAAPSIYAKPVYNYMVAHRQALLRHGVVGADAPIFISLTSEADSATRVAHRYGNLFARFDPSLWRKFEGSDFILSTTKETRSVKVPQWYYYQRTPGHNPLLVNRWIVPADADCKPLRDQTVVQHNLDPKDPSEISSRTFQTSPRKAGGRTNTWKIVDSPPDPKWSTYKGLRSMSSIGNASRCGYWIIRCEGEIINGHNDVWSTQAMETYAALLRESEILRHQKPHSPRR